MTLSQSTINALARVARGETVYAAAKSEGLAPATVYLAIKRKKDKENSVKATPVGRSVATISLATTEMQRCQEAADKLAISRYKFFQVAALEKADQVLNQSTK